MKITKHIHACVDIDGIVFDPGSFGVPDGLDQAEAILITHGHADHVDAEAINGSGLQVFGPADLAGQLTNLRPVADGEVLELAGHTIEVVASPHEEIITSRELPDNLAYVIDGRVIHCGDSFPPVPNMELALVATSAPWLRMKMLEDYLRTTTPKAFAGIHDGLDNHKGLGIRGTICEELARDFGIEYHALSPDESLTI